MWSTELTEFASARGPALIGYAYLLTGDMHRAQDLVQEALVRTYGRPGAVSPDSAEAYVRRVILNLFLDGYRRERAWGRVRHLFVVDDRTPGPESGGPARTDDRVDVQVALAMLPPRERACVVLRFYADLTVPALAGQLGISLGAAKRYLSDGLRRMEQTLGPLAPDPHETLPLHLDGDRR